MTQSRWLIRSEIAIAAIAAVVVTWVLAAPGGVPAWERAVFEAVNGLPEWLYPIVWLPMQFGGLLGAFVVAAAIFLTRRRLPALTYGVAVLLGWLLAVGVKNIVERGRPLDQGLDVIARGDDSAGFGFISGHATVAFAGATIILAFFGPRFGTVAYVIAAVAALARVYVGAHLPLDVVGGAAVGILVASLVAYVEMRILQRQLTERLGYEPDVGRNR